MITNKNTNTITIDDAACLHEFIINQITFNMLDDDLKGVNLNKKTLGLVIKDDYFVITDYNEVDCTIVDELFMKIKDAIDDSFSDAYQGMLHNYINNDLVAYWIVYSNEESIKELVTEYISNMTPTDLLNEQLFNITY